MATVRMNQIVSQLRQATLLHAGGGPTDGQLLEMFLARRDEAAFEALVRRHGPMVYGVCRRVLHNGHDADDAFQATFLVLVRKAVQVVPREKVGNWLHGVAYRTALEARSAAARRRAKEQGATAMAKRACPGPDPPSDLRAILDEEIDRLPEKYRVVVVLCELEGRSRREVARQMGWPEGTLSSRLATARRMLARRLKGRGLAAVGGTLAGARVNEATAAALPGPLVGVTVTAARAIVAGEAAVVSAEVVALTEGVVKAMFLTKLKAVSAVAVTVTLLGLFTGAGAYHTWAAADEKEEQKPPAQAADEKDNRRPPAQPRARLPLAVKSENDTAKNQPSAGVNPVLVRVNLSADGAYLRFHTNIQCYEPVTTALGDGQVLTSYRLSYRTFTENYLVKYVTAYRVKEGKPSSRLERIKGEAIADLTPLGNGAQVLALLCLPGQKIDPGYLPLLRDGTLVFTLLAPSPPAVPPPPAAPAPGVIAPQPIANSTGVPPSPPVATPAPTSADPSPTMAELKKKIENLEHENRRLRSGKQKEEFAEMTVNAPHFQIPFEIEPKYQPDVWKIRLYASTDQKTWQLVAERAATPRGAFDFLAPQDGVYYFAVQMLMKDKTTLFPEGQPDEHPSLKVRVDTAPWPPRKDDTTQAR